MKLSYSDMRDFQSDPRSHYSYLGLKCDRGARHAFWAFQFKRWRRELTFWAAFLLILALAFYIVVLCGVWGAERSEPQATWNADTRRWECPAGYDVYAAEAEAMTGRSFVHCVK